MRFKVETVTSSKLKGTTWEDVDVGDIAMIFISYGRIVSHLQFLYVKDGKFSLSVRHGDLIENLENHVVVIVVVVHVNGLSAPRVAREKLGDFYKRYMIHSTTD
ncbi:hypothetical protein KY289_000124 [Solanum tuberosum]|nr:hypothetical protein KY289_000124 [Solanum tuberosum]